MASARDDHRLQHLVPAVEAANDLCRIITVDYGHGTVHEDQAVAVRATGDAHLHHLDCLEAVLCRVNDVSQTCEALDLLQNDGQTEDVERLVVDDEHAPGKLVTPQPLYKFFSLSRSVALKQVMRPNWRLVATTAVILVRETQKGMLRGSDELDWATLLRETSRLQQATTVRAAVQFGQRVIINRMACTTACFVDILSLLH